MNLPHPDTTDALLEEHFGIGATIEHRSMTAFEWQDYAKRLKVDNEALIATGWDLVDELRDAQAARDRLNTAAETKAARLEAEAATWKVAAYALCALWLMTIGGLAWNLIQWPAQPSSPSPASPSWPSPQSSPCSAGTSLSVR